MNWGPIEDASHLSRPVSVLRGLGFPERDILCSTWGSWGSTARSEMFARSDVDWFCWDSRGVSLRLVETIRNGWATGNIQQRLDLIYCQSDNPADGFALTNGTDLHCLYFLSIDDGCLSAELGNYRERLWCNSYVRAREVLHLIIGLHSFQETFLRTSEQPAKFALGGTRSWTTLAQMAFLRWPTPEPFSTPTGLNRLASLLGCDFSPWLDAWVKSGAIRRQSESLRISRGEVDLSLAPLRCLWLAVLERFVYHNVPWLLEHLRLSKDVLSAFLSKAFGKGSSTLPPIQQSDEAASMVRAFVATTSSEMEDIARTELTWWPLHAVLMNPLVPAHLLERLAFPTFSPAWWSWRNIILYVAKHPNTSTSTLHRIINTPGLREMDYRAARNSLAQRRGNHEC